MESNYIDLIKDILENGEMRDDRTGTGTLSVFGRQLRFNLQSGFPLLTTKKVAWKPVVGELLWFIEGSSDERRLAEITHGSREGKNTIWTGNASANYWKPNAKFPGDLGRVYGVQWRSWQQNTVVNSEESIDHYDGSVTHLNAKVKTKSIDQLQNIIDTIRTNPTDRRMVLTAFNVGELDQMALPPCHMMCQFYVNTRTNTLSTQMYMRSCDVGLGLPFNIASYALLTHMIAQVTGLNVGELIITLGDAHIYLNHIDALLEQIQRQPRNEPKLYLNPEIRSIDGFTMSDISIIGYEPHSSIKMEMAV